MSQPLGDRVFRPREVARVVGLSLTTVNKLRREGLFPAPIKLSAQAVGWREADVREWIDTRERV